SATAAPSPRSSSAVRNSACGASFHRQRAPLSLWVRLRVGSQQAGGVDGGVALGGGERGVAQQLLDRAQVGAGAQQVGGERVAQRVGRRALGEAKPAAQARHQPLHAPGRQRPAAGGAKQRLVGLEREGQGGQVVVNRRLHLRQHRRD